MSMLTIRQAQPKDITTIWQLIRKLAIYEKLEDAFVATPEQLHENIFQKNQAQVLMAQEGEEVVGFALYFFNFSTFIGKHGLYLEDLYIEPEHRGKGYGKKLLEALAKIAQEHDCGRMEWAVLDWNLPSINFYKSLKAKPMDQWTVFRLEENEIAGLAGNTSSML